MGSAISIRSESHARQRPLRSSEEVLTAGAALRPDPRLLGLRNRPAGEGRGRRHPTLTTRAGEVEMATPQLPRGPSALATGPCGCTASKAQPGDPWGSTTIDQSQPPKRLALEKPTDSLHESTNEGGSHAHFPQGPLAARTQAALPRRCARGCDGRRVVDRRVNRVGRHHSRRHARRAGTSTM